MNSTTPAVNPIDALIFSIAGSDAHNMVLLESAQMAMCIWQTMFLIEHDHNVTSVFHTDVACNMLICLWIAITNAFTTSYFYRRAWSFAGRKWWLLIPAVVAIVASLGLGCAVVAYGFMMPQAKVFSDLKLLLEWYEKIGRVAKAWAILSFSMDVLVCISTATKNELKKEQNRPLLRRLYLVTSETMLPPALVALGIFISFELHGVTLMSLDRALCWIMPNVFFLAVLHSLVARQRLATVIFAPNRSTADHPNSTELQKLDDLNLLTGNRDTFNRLHHDRTMSHDSARKSWLPVLSMNAEQALEVDLEGVGSPPKSREFDVRRQSKDDSPPIAGPGEVADETPEIMLGEYQRRWTKHPVNSPYGYPLADR
ncbi:hypothetical protein QFC20_004731 [Naganishia adeliensis]|uniref:Uncharacterized protein n=1 Tax=Naganishia adeliensis TaxID=92952 RepID=A0ACC2VXI1_9TREE|nr:hypothetical protein QFC20_004731 [Naganishia adeliensis]